jgi:hypothetical protein
MAGKYGSPSFSVLLVDGRSLLAAKVKGVTHRVESLHEPGTGLGDSWEAIALTGMQRATLTQDEAFFDDTTASVHDAFKTPSTSPKVVGFGYGGNSIGAPFVGLEGTYAQDYGVLAKVGGLTKANVTYRVSGRLDRGRIISEHVSKAASWNTKTDGSPVDPLTDPTKLVIPITSSSVGLPGIITTPVPHGLTTADLISISGHVGVTPDINDGSRTVTVISATTFSVEDNVTVGGTGGQLVRLNSRLGGAGYQFVSALSGITGFIGKIRSSPDDVTYTDLLTFTNVTAAPAAERVTVAAGAVIDRYLCYSGTFTGTGAITVCIGFART